jgi:hypothetical protein
MSDYLLKRKTKILAKIESTYGTDASPKASDDGVLLASLSPTPLDVDTVDRSLIRPFLGAPEKLIVGQTMKFEVEMEIAGFGTAGPSDPTAGYDALLRACALQSVVDAGTDVEYSPVSSEFDSATIYWEEDGLLYKATGCRGALSLDFKAGEIPTYKATLTGLYAGHADDSSTGLPDVSVFQRPVAVNAANTTGITLGAFSDAVLTEFSLEDGNQIVYHNYPGSSETVRITDRSVSGKLTVQAQHVATFDWLKQVKEMTLNAFSLTHGPAKNQVVVSAPKLQLSNPTSGDADGVATTSFDIVCLPDAGNDDYKITVQ